jgi:hypothetical protein
MRFLDLCVVRGAHQMTLFWIDHWAIFASPRREQSDEEQSPACIIYSHLIGLFGKKARYLLSNSVLRV